MTANKGPKRTIRKLVDRLREYFPETSYMQAQRLYRRACEQGTLDALMRPREPQTRPHPECPRCRARGLDVGLDIPTKYLGNAVLVFHGRWDPTQIVELHVSEASCTVNTERFHVLDHVRGMTLAVDLRRGYEAVRLLGCRRVRESLNDPADSDLRDRLVFGRFVVLELGHWSVHSPERTHRQVFAPVRSRHPWPPSPVPYTIGLPLVHVDGVPRWIESAARDRP